MAKDTEKKASSKAKNSSKNKKKPNKVARWFKDFRGEIKKIFWPDGKTVFKNTLIVIIVVAIAAAVIWLFDLGMSTGMDAVKSAGSKYKEAHSTSDTAGETETSEQALTTVAATE